MRKLGILALVVAGLAGCALTGPYGNFLDGTSVSINETLAADTMKQLVVLYPPASTRFDLGQSTLDAYGTALVQSLRDKGYAILEFDQKTPVKPDTTPGAGPGLRLRYVLDAPAGTNLFRVTVLVGSKSLSRAYVEQNNTVFPAGVWALRE